LIQLITNTLEYLQNCKLITDECKSFKHDKNKILAARKTKISLGWAFVGF